MTSTAMKASFDMLRVYFEPKPVGYNPETVNPFPYDGKDFLKASLRKLCTINFPHFWF